MLAPWWASWHAHRSHRRTSPALSRPTMESSQSPSPRYYPVSGLSPAHLSSLHQAHRRSDRSYIVTRHVIVLLCMYASLTCRSVGLMIDSLAQPPAATPWGFCKCWKSICSEWIFQRRGARGLRQASFFESRPPDGGHDLPILHGSSVLGTEGQSGYVEQHIVFVSRLVSRHVLLPRILAHYEYCYYVRVEY